MGSLITLVALIALLAVGIIIFGAPVHVPMFCGVCVAALMALYLGYKWDAIEKMMMDGIYKALQSICILIIVGILIGVWINAGVVPTMIYYGLQIIHPSIFFIATVLVCSITSLATGTSWGTWAPMVWHSWASASAWHESRYDRRRHPLWCVFRRQDVSSV